MFRNKIWGKSIGLVVVDPQRKFSLQSDGWAKTRDSAVEMINRYSRLFREHGRPVVFVRYDGEPHEPYPGPDGDEWLQGLLVLPEDTVFHKCHMSCFRDSDFEEVLRSMGLDSILLTGMLSEFCVASTYFSASERGIFPYLGKGAHIAYSPKGLEAAEVICNTVDEEVVRTFLEGRQDPAEGI